MNKKDKKASAVGGVIVVGATALLLYIFRDSIFGQAQGTTPQPTQKLSIHYDQPPVGGQVVFTITVNNVGIYKATVIVRDMMNNIVGQYKTNQIGIATASLGTGSYTAYAVRSGYINSDTLALNIYG